MQRGKNPAGPCNWPGSGSRRSGAGHDQIGCPTSGVGATQVFSELACRSQPREAAKTAADILDLSVLDMYLEAA